jgi:hypothetical protein
MSKPDGGQAFPTMSVYDEEKKERVPIFAGMTLRDYLAAKAMQGLLAGYEGPECPWVEDVYEGLASESYAIADAMIAEKAKD